MLSFLVCDTEDEVEVWVTRVIECFERFEMRANVTASLRLWWLHGAEGQNQLQDR